jgi:hypothetical protein
MYTLTLIADERRAFAWAGDRYNSREVADLLIDCIPKDREWDDQRDITFLIPEHVAWEINQLVEEEDYTWTCFASALVAKLNGFCWSIV